VQSTAGAAAFRQEEASGGKGERMERTILHVDMNSFYASVELLSHPELREKPVAVGGNPEKRHGIVLTANIPAKKCGVRTGMAFWQAKEICPDLTVLPAHMDLYIRYSKLARQIYSEYTDLVEPYGIDECFLDCTGSGILFGDGMSIARVISRRVKEELGLTVSIGVSWNKIYAKLGSDYKKPDAITQFSRSNYKKMIYPLPVGELLCVGRSAEKMLRSLGISTIGRLAEADGKMLSQHMGKNGGMLKRFAHGDDTTPVRRDGDAPPIFSIGNSYTLPRDITCDAEAAVAMLPLAESVSARLRKHGFACRTVGIEIRDGSLKSISRQKSMRVPGNITSEIAHEAYSLFKENWNWHGNIRSLGLRASALCPADEPVQMDFFCSEERRRKMKAADEMADEVRRRYGYQSIQRCLAYCDRPLSSLDAEKTHKVHPVSYLQGKAQ